MPHATSATKPLGSYYLVTLTPAGPRRLFQSNNERAFFMWQLQDLLHARSTLEEAEPYKRLAAHIDLLAFSVLPSDVRLLVFAIGDQPLRHLSHTLCDRLAQYQSENRATSSSTCVEPMSVLVRLLGPHHALASSLALHLRHQDVEFDRYSSIGFYLHDRRGAWMRLWRLASLYGNQPGLYRKLLVSHAKSQKKGRVVTALTYNPSARDISA